ncbi:MAG: hypothetical protein AAF491_07090 [Verrucomicrobiota bacterium]
MKSTFLAALLTSNIALWAPHFSSSEESLRVWTSIAGTTVEAKPVGFQAGKVALMREGTDQALVVEASELSEADLRYLHTLYAGDPSLPPLPGEVQISGLAPTEFSELALGEVHGPVSADNQSSYFVYLPQSLKKDRLAPVLMITMPNGGTADQVRQLTEVSERFGIVLASVVESRNANRGDRHNHEHSVACIEAINSRYPVDPDRYIFTGFSGGGATCMINAYRYKGAIGAIPAGAYLHWEMHEETDSKQDLFIYKLMASQDFNRYIGSTVVTLHDQAEMLFFPGNHSPGGPLRTMEAITWLYGKHLSAVGETREKYDFEAAMIEWIRDSLTETDPRKAYYWSHFLKTAYQIEGHNATILKKIDGALSDHAVEGQLYIDARIALTRYAKEQLGPHRMGSAWGHNHPKEAAFAKEQGKAFAALPEIAEIWLALSKPTQGKQKN